MIKVNEEIKKRPKKRRERKKKRQNICLFARWRVFALNVERNLSNILNRRLGFISFPGLCSKMPNINVTAADL